MAMATEPVIICDPEERRQFAFKVVDASVNTYIQGVVISGLDWWTGGMANRTVGILSWEERHEQIAETLYRAALQLGGVAAKAMQFMSLRDDLQPAYQRWFSQAQQNLDIRSSRQHVEEVASAFAELKVLDWEPKWSASIAQVHLCAWGARPAVLKVRHEYVTDSYLADLATMEALGQRVDRYEEARGAAIMLRAIAEKLRPQLEAEINFTREADNQRRVRNNFAGAGIKIPEVYAATESGLVTEMLEGESVADCFQDWQTNPDKDEVREKITSGALTRATRDKIYEAFARMVFEHNFFQMDAHPGNIFLLKGGGIAILDFGQCCELQPAPLARFHEFLSQAPMALAEVEDADRMRAWLALIGVNVQAQRAREAAKLLVFGTGDGIKSFPQTQDISPDFVPLLLILLYLSRLENKASELRCNCGGADDEADHFAVLRAFQSYSRSAAA